MRDYDIFGELRGIFVVKSKGNSREEAIRKLYTKLNDMNIDGRRFSIPLLDGRDIKVDLVDQEISFVNEPLEEEDDDN